MSHYSRSLDLNDLDNPHTLAVLCVPPGATVLDLGVASGEPVARELQAQSCQVFGVDIDQDAAQAASRYCRDVRVADLDDPTALDSWPGPIDVVLALDVLEHLRHPADVLRRAVSRLKTGGFVCVSIPNIAHYSVREQLLHGRFEYTDDGLLDRTHLRFFDWPAVITLFQDAGVEITDVYRIQKPLVRETREGLEAELAEAFMADVEAETFQYFLIGRLGPESAGQGRGVLARLQEHFVEQRSAFREAQLYAEHLESTVAKLEAQVKEFLENEAALPVCEGDSAPEPELTDRMNEIWLLHTQVEMLRKDLEVKDSFLKAAPTVRRTPVEALGYEFPPDVGKTSVIGYRAVDDIVRLIRKSPGWSLISKWAWRNDRYPS